MENEIQYIIGVAIGVNILLIGTIVWVMLLKAKQKMLKQQAVYNAILETEKSEQSRIGQDLHDAVGPNLASIKIHLMGLEERYGDESSLPVEFSDTLKLLEATGRLVREASHNLVPKEIIGGNLVESIEGYCAEVSTGSHQVDCFLPVELNSVSEQTRLHLFRIVMELLTNSLKHSKATDTWVQGEKMAKGWRILVGDNGIGLTDNRAKGGIGFENLSNRVAFLNGEWTCRNRSEGGLECIIEIP